MQNSLSHADNNLAVANLKAKNGRAGILASVFSRLLNWKRRSYIGKLDNLNNYGLADIGLNREDLDWARGLPLHHNPMLALDDLARSRSRARRHAVVKGLPGTRVV